MRVTIVEFTAYQRPFTEVFYDKTPEEINAYLFDMCSTYEPTKIVECANSSFVALSTLKNLRDAN